jgi:hypothetical protein
MFNTRKCKIVDPTKCGYKTEELLCADGLAFVSGCSIRLCSAVPQVPCGN